MLSVLKGFVGAGSGVFHNGILGGANYRCSVVTEFWVPKFGESPSAINIARDSVSFVKLVRGVKVASRG